MFWRLSRRPKYRYHVAFLGLTQVALVVAVHTNLDAQDLTNVCCSDQQSFFENGFPAVGFFETPNPFVVYPQYHTSDDLLQFLSTEKIYLLAKATLASAIVFAEPTELLHHHAGVNGTAVVANASAITL